MTDIDIRVYAILNASETVMVGEFATEQDPDVLPHYKVLTELDPRVIAWRLQGHPDPTPAAVSDPQS